MRYLIDFSYSGANFNGYQKQPKLRTVQETIEKVLTSINNSKEVTIYSSGRTDALVNALHQMAHFDLDYDLPLYKIKSALNSYLPDDIYIETNLWQTLKPTVVGVDKLVTNYLLEDWEYSGYEYEKEFHYPEIDYMFDR